MPRKPKPTPIDHIEQALVLIDDGALRQGVDLLRQSAAAIEAFADARDAAMAKAIGKRAPKGPKITSGGGNVG
jgi:hypothetical protein